MKRRDLPARTNWSGGDTDWYGYKSSEGKAVKRLNAENAEKNYNVGKKTEDTNDY